MGSARSRRGRGAAREAVSRCDPSATSTSAGRPLRSWHGVLAAFTLGITVVTLAVGTPMAWADDDGQAARGAAIYALSCAVCHGATGRGFAEAVAAFPADYRDCTRCHQPTNAPQMPGSQVGLATTSTS